MSDVLGRLPRPLLDDIVLGRWLPVVGAGLSRNAVVASGDPPPDWNGLAARLKTELADPEDTYDAVDVISAYRQEHGRAALIERVARAIRVADAMPGNVHRALCRLPIDVLITTNFDQLLEQAFRDVRKPCHPVLDEHQLAIANPFPGPTLVKIHGDITRPERMVLTEEDFDRFLIRNPLLSTIVASYFAQRSIVLIGYSLSDPDLRQILALVRERLGEGSRAIYSLEVDPAPSKIARFARRHVRVVPLPGDAREPAPVLTQLFDEIFAELGRISPSTLRPKTHESGLALTEARVRRTCFLSATAESLPEYNEWLRPAAGRLGVSLVGMEDFVAPGESLTATLDAVVAAAGAAVIEVGSSWTVFELGIAVNRVGPTRILLVVPEGVELPLDMANCRVVRKPDSPEQWEALSDEFGEWLVDTLDLTTVESGVPSGIEIIGEIMLLAGELELRLGDRMQTPPRFRSLSRLARDAGRRDLIKSEEVGTIEEFVVVRNAVAHGRLRDLEELSAPSVSQLLRKVRDITERLRREL